MANQAKSSVLVIPDTTGFAAKLAAQVDKAAAKVTAKIAVTPNLAKFGTSLKAAVAQATKGVAGSVVVNADTSGFGASVDAAIARASGGEVTVAVKADGTGFGGEVDRIVDRSRGKKVPVKVKADKSELENLADAFKRLNRDANDAGGGIVSALKWPLIISGASLATAAVTSLSGGLVALTSSLGPLVGLLPALAAGGGALALGLGVSVGAFQGIGDALKAFTKGQKEATTAVTTSGTSAKTAARQAAAAAESIRSAQEGVERSQRSLTNAQERALNAVKRLTDARREAAEVLDDEARSTERAALSEKRANLNLIEARKRLNNLGADGVITAQEVADAQLDVAEAELAVREAQDARADQEERFLDLQQRGIEGSEQVVSAQEDIEDANQAVVDSQKGVEDATRQLTLALQAATDTSEELGASTQKVDDFAAAMAGLSPAAQSLVNTLNDFRTPLLALRDTAAEGLFPGLEGGLRAITPLFATFTPIVSTVATTLGGLATRFGELLASPLFTAAFTTLGEASVTIIQNLGDAFIEMAPALTTLITAAAPFAVNLSAVATSAAELFNSFIQGKAASSGLATFFETAQSTLSLVSGIFKDIGGVFRDLFSAAFPVGQEFLGLLKDATGNLRDLTQAGLENGSLREFFESIKPSILSLSGLVGDLVTGFGKIGVDLIPQIAPFIELVRKDLVPAFLNLFSTLDGDFLESMVGLAVAALDIADAFLPATPVLVFFVEALAKLLDIGGFLLTDLGPLSAALVGFSAVFSVFKIGKFVTELAAAEGILGSFFRLVAPGSGILARLAPSFARVAAAVGTFRDGLLMLTRMFVKFAAQSIASAARSAAAWVASAARSIASFVATAASAVASAAATAAAWLVAAAPFIALGAVVVGVTILIVKNWDTIKKVVGTVVKAVAGFLDNLIDGVVDFAKKWGVFLLGPIGVIFHFRDEVFDALKAVGGFFLDLLGGIVDFAKEWGILLLGPIGFVIKFRDQIGEILGDVIGFFVSLPGKVGSALLDGIGILADAAGQVGGAIRDGIFGAFTGAVGFAADIGGAIVDSVRGFLNDFVIKGLNAGISRLADLLGDVNIPGVGRAFDAASNLVRKVRIPELHEGAIVKGSPRGTVIDVAGRPVIAGDKSRDEAVIPLPPGLLAALERIANGQVGPMVGSMTVVAPNPMMSGREVIRSLRSAQAVRR